MNPFTVTTTIARPRAEVFEYLADIANHSEFSAGYTSEWRLTRINSYGQGAGARFRTHLRFNRFSWADMTFVRVEPPYRIVAVGRTGKFNRIKTFASWTLPPSAGDGTTVEYVVESEPTLITDRLLEMFSARRVRFAAQKGLKRLKRILEDHEERRDRVTIAGL